LFPVCCRQCGSSCIGLCNHVPAELSELGCFWSNLCDNSCPRQRMILRLHFSDQVELFGRVAMAAILSCVVLLLSYVCVRSNSHLHVLTFVVPALCVLFSLSACIHVCSSMCVHVCKHVFEVAIHWCMLVVWHWASMLSCMHTDVRAWVQARA
jgi:hypothetical protein